MQQCCSRCLSMVVQKKKKHKNNKIIKGQLFYLFLIRLPNWFLFHPLGHDIRTYFSAANTLRFQFQFNSLSRLLRTSSFTTTSTKKQLQNFIITLI